MISKSAVKKACLDWCKDQRLKALVAIASDPEEGAISTLWSRIPTSDELEYLGYLFPAFTLDYAISGSFHILPRASTLGDPPLAGQQGRLTAGDEICGFVSATSHYLPSHSLGGLFQDDGGTRYALTAGHALWDSDVAVWINQSNNVKLGPVSVLSPPSFPKDQDQLKADVGLVTVDESGLQGRETSWADPQAKLRKCGATTGCTYTKRVPTKRFCVKVRYAEGVCVTLIDQLIVDDFGFAVGGDSGALAESKPGTEVGMVVAVSDTRQFTVVTPWNAVLEAVGLEGEVLTRLT